MLSQPDPRRTAEALRVLDFSVHLDLFSNPTSRFADILLPVNSPREHEAVKAGFEIGLRWWQEAPDLGLSGSDPFERRSNYNLLVDDYVRDPVSGSVPCAPVPATSGRCP